MAIFLGGPWYCFATYTYLPSKGDLGQGPEGARGPGEGGLPAPGLTGSARGAGPERQPGSLLLIMFISSRTLQGFAQARSGCFSHACSDGSAG